MLVIYSIITAIHIVLCWLKGNAVINNNIINNTDKYDSRNKNLVILLTNFMSYKTSSSLNENTNWNKMLKKIINIIYNRIKIFW